MHITENTTNAVLLRHVQGNNFERIFKLTILL